MARKEMPSGPSPRHSVSRNATLGAPSAVPAERVVEAVRGRTRRVWRKRCRGLYFRTGRERRARMDLDFKGIVKNLTQSAEARAVARALQLYSKGQLDRAIAVLKEAQSKSPDDPAVLLELGRLLTHAGRAAEGVEAFRAMLRKDSRSLQKVNEAIEELRAHKAPAGPLYDAVAEHHIRHDNPTQALMVLDRMKPEEIRAALHRHLPKYEQARKTAPKAKLNKTSLLPAYHAALLHECLREPDKTMRIFRDILRTNPEESERILPRLEALAGRDYQNAEMRLQVASMLLDAQRVDDAARHFGLALETAPQAARTIAEQIGAHLAGGSDHQGLRWALVSGLLAAGDAPAAIEAMRPLVAAGVLLDEIIGALQPLASKEKAGPALRLLAAAFSKRNQPLQSLGPLLQASEEEGLASIQECLQELIEAHPDVMRAHQLLADIHLEAGRGEPAIQALRRAHDLGPKEGASLLPRVTRALLLDRGSREAHLMLADLLRQAGDAERAVVVLRHLLGVCKEAAGEVLDRLGPLQAQGGGPRARIGLAEVCLALKRCPEALQHLESVATSHPEMSAEFLHATGLLIGLAPDLAPRLVALLTALEPRSPLPVAVHFARGEAQFQAGQLPASAASFREVLQSVPERVQEVRKALEKFDRSDPRAAEARYLLASIYLDQRDHEAAIQELNRPGPTHAALLAQVLRKYEEILAESPQDLAARAGLMQALLLARQFDRALEIGRDTLKIRDDETTARVSLGMAQALHEKGDADGAVRRYFTAFRRDPALAGEVLEKLRRLLGVEGKHPFGCLALGKILAHEGRVAEALGALRAAREADPQLNDSVLQELEGMVRQSPADPQPGLALIALLQEAGQNARAVQAISMHLDAHPDSAQRLAAHLDEILKAEPAHPLAQYELGRALQAIGAHARSAERYQAAAGLDGALATMVLRRLQEILAADPACTPAWVASADILAARGQPLQAAERLAEAIARSPRGAGSLLARLEELYQQNPGQGDLAILFAEACVRCGEHARAARAYGNAAAQDLAYCDAALKGISAILEAEPRLAEAHVLRARTRLRLSQGEAALRDLAEAARLGPRLLPEVLREIEAMAEQRPDWSHCTLQLAEMYDATGRGEDAEALLSQRLQTVPSGEARLQILLRLARSAAERQDEHTARARMREAAGLASDRNAFLMRIHAMQIEMLRARVGRVRDRTDLGPSDADDLMGAVQASVDLGALDEALALLQAHGTILDASAVRFLRATVALRRGDYPRAADQLKSLGPSPLLAHGALRAGDYALAVETLESLLARSADPPTRRLLERTYREMVAAELLGGSRRLQAETTLLFGEGAAA